MKVIYRTRFNCPKCSVRLKRVKKDRHGNPALGLENQKCPRCGKKNLELRDLIDWD